MKGTRSYFLFGVHMDNVKSQHTLWMEMADVCWAHYFTDHTFNDHYAERFFLFVGLKSQNVYFLFVR